MSFIACVRHEPMIDPTTGTVHSLDGLVRWRRNGKLQPPDTFLPIVEQSPLMIGLSDRVIELATAQLALWRDAGLGLRVVAESVEDAPTLAYLQELGCDLAQGYHIAKPLAASQVEDWLSQHTAIFRTPPVSAPVAA